MKNVSPALKILIYTLLCLVVIALIFGAVWLFGRGETVYETVDTSYRPTEATAMPAGETIAAPEEETETEAILPEEDSAEETEETASEETVTEETETETESAAETETETETETGPDADGFYACDDTITVTGNSVNIRSRPNTDCEILGSSSQGASFHRSGYNDDNWFRIDYSGRTAYISGDYAQVTG